MVKLAFYREEDWNRFLQIIDDREKVHDTWEEWLKSAEELRRTLKAEGFDPVYVVIDLDELMIWCRKQGRKNDGAARAVYTQQL